GSTARRASETSAGPGERALMRIPVRILECHRAARFRGPVTAGLSTIRRAYAGWYTISITITRNSSAITPPDPATRPVMDDTLSPRPSAAVALSSAGTTTANAMATAMIHNTTDNQIHNSENWATGSLFHGAFMDIRPNPKMTTTTEAYE